jgi:hypothetical protein
MRNSRMSTGGKIMAGNGNRGRQQGKVAGDGNIAVAASHLPAGAEGLRLRTQQLALREQLERHHFLLERLTASSTRLIQALEVGDVYESIAEIIGNLIGCEEIAIFQFDPFKDSLTLDWSWGIDPESLHEVSPRTGIIGRAVQAGVTMFPEYGTATPRLAYEKKLTGCVVLKASRVVVGAIAIFGLLPQKNRLEWADFELLKFLEVYAAVAVQYQKLRERQTES